MTDQQHVSVLQFTEREGAMHLKDYPHVQLHTVAEQGSVTGSDWQGALDMPVYWEEWERMARVRSDAHSGTLRFILMDESPTRLPETPRLHPKQIALPTVCALELAHSGFVVGSVYGFFLGVEAMRGALPGLLNVTLPTQLDGDYVLGSATFFDSPMSLKAREGLRRGLFTHVCPVVWSPPGAPVGTGVVVQVSLVPGDYPGCPNARVLEWSG